MRNSSKIHRKYWMNEWYNLFEIGWTKNIIFILICKWLISMYTSFDWRVQILIFFMNSDNWCSLLQVGDFMRLWSLWWGGWRRTTAPVVMSPCVVLPPASDMELGSTGDETRKTALNNITVLCCQIYDYWMKIMTKILMPMI